MSALERLSRRLSEKCSQIDLRSVAQSMSPCAGDGASDSASGRSAVRMAKRRIGEYSPAGTLDKKLAACLTSLLDRLPREGARAVAKDILDCNDDDEKLYEVYYNLFVNLLLPMKAKCRLVLPPATPSPDGLDEGMEWKEKVVIEDCHFRDTCFKRDGFMCPVTGAIDIDQWLKLGAPSGLIRSRVEVAHVIPLTYAYPYPDDLPDFMAQRWDTLLHCFPALKQTNVNSANLREPFNGVSLEKSIYDDFSLFKVAFQKSGTNAYRVKTLHKFTGLKRIFSRSQVIRYNTTNTQGVAPPDPQLLAVHHTIAEILCDSGLGDDIEEALKGIEKGLGWGLPDNGRADAGHLLTVAIGTA